jgi:hypothetical protein
MLCHTVWLLADEPDGTLVGVGFRRPVKPTGNRPRYI